MIELELGVEGEERGGKKDGVGWVVGLCWFGWLWKGTYDYDGIDDVWLGKCIAD